MFGEPKKHFQTYGPINDPGPSIFVFGSVLSLQSNILVPGMSGGGAIYGASICVETVSIFAHFIARIALLHNKLQFSV